MEIITNNTTAAEFFVRITDPLEHKICLTDGHNFYQELSADTQPLAQLKTTLPPLTHCRITCTGLEICLGYYYEPPTVLQDGVTFLVTDSTKQQSTHQERYHFTPYKNWMNDPNGLCWYQGYYHMFYQFHPYAPEPGCMYWGHAASRDLIHWHHLPVVFAPQRSIMQGSSYRGGAWSGSALPLKDEVRLFFTRHIGPVSDRSVKHEYQVMVSSNDLITFSEETVMIDEQPEDGVSNDIRDPNIFCYQNNWYMVLGSACNHNPAVLLYKSEDLASWNYQGILYQEISKDTVAFECPDFFEMGGKYILTLSKMRHTDEFGRKDPTHYYIGTFDGSVFYPEHEDILDFGGNLYAVQSFFHKGRRLAFGWICDFYQEHIQVGNAVYGSMSLPREYRLDAGQRRLLVMPAKETGTLPADILYKGAPDRLNLPLPSAACYLCLHCSPPGKFIFTLNKRRDGAALMLLGTETSIEVKTIGVASENSRFLSPVMPINKVEIFIDYRTCEIFINDGEAAATKIFYGDAGTKQISYEFLSGKELPLLTVRHIGAL